jgi:ATP-dependent protease ClpP protease subunit
MRLVALLALLFVILGLPTININHNLHLPNAQSVIDPEKIVSKTEGLIFRHTHTDITMNDEIKSPQSLKDIADVLRKAESGDTVTFHMVGLGGNLESVVYILNNIKTSKATVNMVVEGNVYSGHAYLSALGGNLEMLPNTFLMFHTFSGYGVDCAQDQGTDRTVSNKEHCEAFLGAIQNQVTSLINSISFLTPEEKKAILTGHDVYITKEMYDARVANQ